MPRLLSIPAAALILLGVRSGGNESTWRVDLREKDGTELALQMTLRIDGDRWALSGSEDKTIRVWDLRTGQEVWRGGTTGRVLSVAPSPDGQRAIVAFTGSGDVGVFDRGKRTLVKRIPLGRNAVAGMESRVFQKTFGSSPAPVGILISPDGRHAWVAASHADVVSVINLDELKVDDAWPAGKEPDGLAGTFGKK